MLSFLRDENGRALKERSLTILPKEILRITKSALENNSLLDTMDDETVKQYFTAIDDT